jgi:hypothetical protein
MRLQPDKLTYPNRVRNIAMTLVIGLTIIITAFLLLHQSKSVFAATWVPGDVFVTGSQGNIRVYDSSGNFKEQVSTGYGGGVANCAFNSNGDLYALDGLFNVVVKFDPITHIATPVVDVSTNGSFTKDIWFANSGDFFVSSSDLLRNRFIRYNSSGIHQQNYQVAYPHYLPSGPVGMDLATDQQTMYYSSAGPVIRRYDLATSSWIDDLVTLVDNVTGLRIIKSGSHSGQFLVASTVNIKRMAADGGYVGSYDYSGENSWSVISLDPTDNNVFWATGRTTNRFFKFSYDAATPSLAILHGSSPSGICIKPGIIPPSPTPTSTPTTEPQPPSYTKSYYIQVNSSLDARQLGCEARVRGEKGLVILDFGAPVVLSSGDFGTLLPKAGVRVNFGEIASMVLEFAQGYNTPTMCFYSPPFAYRDLLIVVGVSNSALQNESDIWHDNQALTYEHGVAWANMMSGIYDKLNAYGYYPFIRVAGGIDAEYYGATFADCRNPITGRRGPCPNPNPSIGSAADQWTVYSVQGSTNNGTSYWVEGYNQQQIIEDNLLLFNFGSCEDCQRRGNPNSWNPTDLEVFSRTYHLSWQLPTGVPYPQIYHEPYPYEWYNVRWYTYSVQGENMNIAGVLTQCGSANCLDGNPSSRLQPRFDTACHPDPHCNVGTDWPPYSCVTDPCPNFPPSPGWQALSDAISSPNSPEGTPNPILTPQPSILYGVSDIHCQVPALCSQP